MNCIRTLLLLSCIIDITLSWSTISSSFNNNKFCHSKKYETKLNVKRGRGTLGKEVGFEGTNNDEENKGIGNTNKKGLGSSTSSGPVINWIPIQVTTKELPKENNVVGIIDTNLPTMKVSQTNPTGAVSVIKYKDITYCFSINCPSCKIPLTKAKVIDGDMSSNNQPRIVCDLCKSTYNVKTGEKLKSAIDNPGILGGIAKTIFSSQDTGNLKTYKLGEKNGKLLIALD